MVATLAIALFSASAMAQFDGPAPLAWRWAQPTSVAPGGPPVVSGDTVFVAVGARMYALDIASGTQKWRYPAADPLPANFRRGAVLTGTTLIGAADNKTIYAVNTENGTLRWQYSAIDAITSEIMTDGKVAVFQLGDNSFSAVDVETGKQAWASPLVIADGVMGFPIVFRDKLIICTQAYHMLGIDLDSKRTSWNTGFTELAPDVKPAIFGDLLVVNSGDYIIAVNGNGGGARWQRNAGEPLSSSPAVSAEGVFAVTRDGKALSFDSTGKRMMKTGLDLESTLAAAPTALGRYALVPTLNGSLNLIDFKAGSVIWNYIIRPLPGTAFAAPPPGGGAAGGGSQPTPAGPPTFVTVAGPAVLAGTTLLVTARDGSLLAFDKSAGVDLTPPSVRMAFPNPGDQVNPGPPFALFFRVEDEASGVNLELASVTIDGVEVKSKITRDGVLSVQFGGSSGNSPMSDGRKVIIVKVYDWMGNKNEAAFSITADSSVRMVAPPGASPAATPPGGRGGGG